MEKYPTGSLFRDQKGQPLTKASVCGRLKSLRKAVNQQEGRVAVRPEVTAYSYRHAFVMRWLEKGQDAPHLGELFNTSLHQLHRQLTKGSVMQKRTLNAELLQCLRIDCPRWYRRKDFQDFLNHRTQDHAKKDPAEAFWGLATWHRPGDKPGEMSDVFITYDHGESGDMYAMPDDIWGEIVEAAEEHGMEYGVIWIVNC